MADLSVQNIDLSGLDVALSSAAAGGDAVDQGAEANVFLYVKNGSSSSMDVTVTAENTTKEVPNWGALSQSDAVVSVPDGEFRLIGPFPFGPFTRNLSITYSDESSVEIAAVRLPSTP